MAQKLQDLGYRYRYYLFHGQEHYGPPAVDQWAEGADYLHRFVRNPNPQRVTYVRSMGFENAIERVNSGGVRSTSTSATPTGCAGCSRSTPTRASRDSTAPRRRCPPSGTPPTRRPTRGPKTGNAAPFTMAGQAWKADPAAPRGANAFTATLSGARAVTLELGRMRLSADKRLSGDVRTDAPLTLTLDGVQRDVQVTIDGTAVAATRDGDALAIDVPPGTHEVVVRPA